MRRLIPPDLSRHVCAWLISMLAVLVVWTAFTALVTP